MLPCLTDIIGLTDSDCACITDLLQVDPRLADPDQTSALWYKNSTSGYYLDQLPGIVQLDGADGGGDCSKLIATIYATALEQAKKDTVSLFIKDLTARYRQAVPNYIGNGGGVKFNGNTGALLSMAGIWIDNAYMRGSTIKIKSILGMFSAPPPELFLYRITPGYNSGEYDAELITTIDSSGMAINTTARLPVPETDDFLLSMDEAQYAILYNTVGVVAKNNRTECDCGRVEQERKKYFLLKGVTLDSPGGASIENVKNWKVDYALANGLALEVEAGCNSDQIFCSLYNSEDNYKKAVPWAVLYRAGYLVNQAVFNSSELNYDTLSNRDQIQGNRNHYDKKFKEFLAWLIDNVAIDRFTDCYACNPYQTKISKTNRLING